MPQPQTPTAPQGVGSERPHLGPSHGLPTRALGFAADGGLSTGQVDLGPVGVSRTPLDSLSVKDSACSAGHRGSTPGLGRSPGNRKGYPLQRSCLENPTGHGAFHPRGASSGEGRTGLTQAQLQRIARELPPREAHSSRSLQPLGCLWGTHGRREQCWDHGGHVQWGAGTPAGRLYSRGAAPRPPGQSQDGT